MNLVEWLQELNETGSFPDEAEKTPMVSLFLRKQFFQINKIYTNKIFSAF